MAYYYFICLFSYLPLFTQIVFSLGETLVFACNITIFLNFFGNIFAYFLGLSLLFISVNRFRVTCSERKNEA